MTAGTQAARFPMSGVAAPKPAFRAYEDPNLHNSFRKSIFYYSLIYIFIRFSMIHEAAAHLLGINLYLAYIFGLPSMIGVLLTGGFTRLLRDRLVLSWIAFAILIVAATMFSTWRGGSLDTLIPYFKTEWTMLFVVAGLAMSWDEVKLLYRVMLLSGFSSLIVAKLLMKSSAISGRIELNIVGGSIANSNDLAGHVLLLLPFYLYAAVKTGQNFAVRLLCIAASAYSTYIILGTGSRGAMIGLIAMGIGFFLISSTVGKMGLLVLLPLAGILTFTILPSNVQQRLTNFDSKIDTEDQVSGDAAGSLSERKRLFQSSLLYTVTHPLFGVGPGMFAVYDDKMQRGIGLARGAWHNTHNIYTQISSECGIPAFLCYVSTLFGSFFAMRRLRSQTKNHPDLVDIHEAATTMLLALSGFLVAIGFLTIAYRFQIGAMAGIGIITSIAGQQEVARRLALRGAAVPQRALQSLTPLGARLLNQPRRTQPLS